MIRLDGGTPTVGDGFRIAGENIGRILSWALFAATVGLVLRAIQDRLGILGKVVIGTVQGDLHDIGKNLVAILLKGAGFEVIDLGNDVSPERFLDTAQKENADIIGMSALLTTTMPVMKAVVDLAKERGVHGSMRIIVGGAPLSADYAREIGADAYCYDGVSAVECVKKFLGRG